MMPVGDGRMGWFALMGAGQLRNGTVQPLRLAGVPLAVWRTGDGQASVWLDRCPHRGMRLSFGEVQDDLLLCPYHGWSFGADAQCKTIPAHPDKKPPRTARAAAMQVVEADGLIWGGAPQAAGFDAPALPEGAAGFTLLRSIVVSSALDQVASGLIGGPLLPGSPLHASGGALLAEDHAVLMLPVDMDRTLLHVLCAPDMDIARKDVLVTAVKQLRFALHAAA